ncbi:hypothetical protein BH09BAC5_BH09BAC5_29290 [soil metagenome]
MKKKNLIFPIVVGILSLMTIVKIVLHPFDIFGIASVIVGMTGIVLFIKEKNSYDKFFYAWVFMQLPNVYLTSKLGIETPILNAFPTSLISLDLSFGIRLGLQGNNFLTIYLNALPFGLVYLLRYLNVEKPLGNKISISRLRKGTFPQIQFPIIGMVEKIAGRNKIAGVYLINLDNEIQIKEKTYKYIFLDPKDSTLIELSKERQVCGLLLCENPAMPYVKQQNPFVDWVTIIEAK